MPNGSGSRDARSVGDASEARDGLESGLALRIHTLGGFLVRAVDRAVIDDSWSRTKAKAILKLLTIESRPLHRDHVVEVLWPDSNAAAGSNSLRQSIHHLRSAFECSGLPSPVVTLGGSLSLRAGVWTDIAEFRRAAAAARATRKDILLYERAVDLYGGDLLPLDIYEEWTQAPRHDLKDLHLRLLSELAELCRSEGRCETAEELLQRVLQADPLREAEHQLLMRVYIHCGRGAEAARQYQVCREVIQRELGVTPSAETEALYREALEGAAGHDTAPAAPANGGIRRPEIRHATTSDGLAIAYSTSGDGDPW